MDFQNDFSSLAEVMGVLRLLSDLSHNFLTYSQDDFYQQKNSQIFLFRFYEEMFLAIVLGASVII